VQGKLDFVKANLICGILGLGLMAIDKTIECFKQVDLQENADWVKEIASDQDVGLYAALTLLSAPTYDEFRELYNNPNLKKLSRMSIASRDLVSNLAKKEFKKVAHSLSDLGKVLALDPYLQNSLATLLHSSLRNIAFYFISPFSRISMASLQETMGVDENFVCTEILGQDWKLDIKDNSLVRKGESTTSEQYRRVFQMLIDGLKENNLKAISEGFQTKKPKAQAGEQFA